MSAPRFGRSGIEAILDELVDRRLLPSEKSDRSDKKACLRTYGMLRSFFDKALTSSDPTKEYREMLATESALRHRLKTLSSKAIPQEVVDHLNELRAAICEMIQLGPDGVIELHKFEEVEMKTQQEQGADELLIRRPANVHMVPITTLKQVRDELQKEKEKNGRLNAENNALARQLKQVLGERDELLRSRRS